MLVRAREAAREGEMACLLPYWHDWATLLSSSHMPGCRAGCCNSAAVKDAQAHTATWMTPDGEAHHFPRSLPRPCPWPGIRMTGPIPATTPLVTSFPTQLDRVLLGARTACMGGWAWACVQACFDYAALPCRASATVPHWRYALVRHVCTPPEPPDVWMGRQNVYVSYSVQ